MLEETVLKLSRDAGGIVQLARSVADDCMLLYDAHETVSVTKNAPKHARAAQRRIELHFSTLDVELAETLQASVVSLTLRPSPSASVHVTKQDMSCLLCELATTYSAVGAPKAVLDDAGMLMRAELQLLLPSRQSLCALLLTLSAFPRVSTGAGASLL